MMKTSDKIDYFSDEIKTLIRLAQNQDPFALEQLVKINSPLLTSLVKKYVSQNAAYEDLFQIASIGLIKAIKKFNFDFDNKFSTYAVYVIVGELRRHFRDEGIIKVSRSVKTLYLKAKKITEEYTKQTGTEPTIKYLSEKLNSTPEEVLTAFEACMQPTSLYSEINNAKDNSVVFLMDKIEDDKFSNEDLIERIDLKNAINNLDKRDRQIIILRYFKNMTQSEVAKVLGISQVQISRIEKKVITSIKSSWQII